MSEYDEAREFNEARAEELVEARIWSGNRHPAIERIMRMSDAENIAYLEGDENASFRNRRECQCYWKGFVSMSKAQKEAIRCDHIKAGKHQSWCPAFQHRRDYEPYDLSLTPEAMRPSYTQAQQRLDAEAEAVDYSRGPGRFRWNE